MKRKQMQEEIKNYLLKVRADREKAGITKVPEFDARDVKLAYGAGLQSGLWHHSYDYLVKTAGLKEKYMNRITELEAQIEKMKCCANCKKYWRMCEYGDREMQICEKWEIKEK